MARGSPEFGLGAPPATADPDRFRSRTSPPPGRPAWPARAARIVRYRRSVSSPIDGRWLGRVPYREGWALQHRLVARRADGEIADQLLLLEHDAVLTLGRNADPSHVRVLPALLEERGMELIRVERGGEVTYHGPGQLIAYPLLRLAERGMLIRPYVRALEAAMAATAAAYGVTATRREGLPGLWVNPDGPMPRKLGAIGV